MCVSHTVNHNIGQRRKHQFPYAFFYSPSALPRKTLQRAESFVDRFYGLACGFGFIFFDVVADLFQIIGGRFRPAQLSRLWSIREMRASISSSSMNCP